MELVRKLLLQCEAIDEPEAEPVDLSAYSQEKLMEHRHLVWQAGLARGSDGSSSMGYDAFIDGLTWEGHDFLEAARNETLWRKAVDRIRSAGAAATIETFKLVLRKLSMEALGLTE
jgi:hypothetical protein